MSTGWTAPGSAPGTGAPEAEAADGASQHGPGTGGSPGETGRGAGGPGLQRELVPQMPLFPLRPLGVGEVLGAAVRIYRLRPKPVLAVSAAVHGVSFALITLITGAGMVPFIGDMQAVMDDPTAEPVGGDLTGDMVVTVVTSLFTGVISMIAAALVTVVLTAIAIGEASGRALPTEQIWPTMRRLGLRAIAVSLLIGVLGMVAFAVPLVLGVVPALIVQEASLLTVLPVIGGLALGVLAVIWIWARTLLAVPSLVIEELGIVAAFRRSFTMTAGRRLWRVLGVGVLVMVLYYFAVQVISGVFGTVGFVAYMAILLASQLEALVIGVTVMTVVMMIGAYIATFLLAPFYSAGIAAVYADNRMRHEAWDVELQRTARESWGDPGRPADGPR